MAHVTEPPIRAIESALRAGSKARRSVGTFIVQLMSPLALLGKGIVDLSHCFTPQATGGYTFDNLVIPLLAVAAVTIGGAACIVLTHHFISSRKDSDLDSLARVHVAELLGQMGKKPVE